MANQRRYSKAKANANRVVWTSQEVIPVPFELNGLAFHQAEWGIFRVTGRDMYCTGFRVDFRVPSGSSRIRCNVGIYTGDDVLAMNGRLTLDGVTMGGDRPMSPAIPMPVNSIWKFKMEIEAPDDSSEFFPEGVTATYLLRYAQGPVNTKLFSNRLREGGVGFDQIGVNLIVELVMRHMK